MKRINTSARMFLVCVWVLVWFKAPLVYGQCPALSEQQMRQAVLWSGKPLVGNIYKLTNWYVQDGDSLSLAMGHRLRLGQINATEMAAKGRPEQAYAKQAQVQLKQQLQQHPLVYLQLQPEIKDHYGRWIVKLYDGLGASAEASLVAQGLAYVISMQGQGTQACLWRQESLARRQGLGLWQAAISQVRKAAELTSLSGGFMRLQGTVTDISQSQQHWYIGLGGQVGVKIAKHTLAASPFGINSASELEAWKGQTLTVRGWLAWRKLNKKQRKKGFKAGLMSLYHWQMLEQLRRPTRSEG